MVVGFEQSSLDRSSQHRGTNKTGADIFFTLNQSAEESWDSSSWSLHWSLLSWVRCIYSLTHSLFGSLSCVLVFCANNSLPFPSNLKLSIEIWKLETFKKLALSVTLSFHDFFKAPWWMYIKSLVLSLYVSWNSWQCVWFLKYCNWHRWEALIKCDIDSLKIWITHPLMLY